MSTKRCYYCGRWIGGLARLLCAPCRLSFCDPARRTTRHLFEVIWRRDAGLCRLCGEPCKRERTMRADAPWSATLDHIVPVASGGSDNPENLQLAHRLCNARKGARPIHQPIRRAA